MSEENIALFFNNESNNMSTRQETKGLPESAIHQNDLIVGSNAHLALDIGSGPGNVLIDLIDKGVDSAIGIDLSPKMSEIAIKNIKKHDMDDRAEIIVGSFLDTDFDRKIDAISMHRVLCCHPDREGMLSKSMAINPQIITLTVPRDWKIMRVVMAVVGVVLDKLGKFRPFIHSQKVIDNQLSKNGYTIIDRLKGKIWVTSTYRLGA